MKKRLSLLLLYACMAAAAFAQKLVIPPAVTSAFNSRFSGATEVKWEKENSKELEANFKLNRTIVSANFGLDGSWKETEITIDPSELPVSVANAVTTKYPGTVITLAEKIEKPGGKVLYEVTIKVNGKKKELELMPDGSFIK